MLNKLGLEFTDAHAEGTAEDAAQRPGNCIPTKVPCKGTRLCIAGDKVAQSIRSIRQCVTSPMKRLLKRLPVEAGEPEAFKSLLQRIQKLFPVIGRAGREISLSKAFLCR